MKSGFRSIAIKSSHNRGLLTSLRCRTTRAAKLMAQLPVCRWTPSVCDSSFTSSTGNLTPECWETCDWSGNEDELSHSQEVRPIDDWDICGWSSSDAGSYPGSPEGNSGGSFCVFQAASTPRRFQLGEAQPLDSSSLTPVRRSPRARAPRPKFDPSRTVTSDDGWQLSSVMDLQGCQPRCVTQVHGLGEYDVLIAHSAFTSKSVADRRAWLFDYFATNCPHNEHGEKDPKKLKYILCGRTVCQAVWQGVLSISTSTFYNLRKDFLDGKRAEKNVCMRSLAPKSMEAVAWMSSYFNRVGDKRPDKDGIYLPSCLSEKSIHSLMVEDFDRTNAGRERCVCLSQFNRLFRTHFSNVTIPKVC